MKTVQTLDDLIKVSDDYLLCLKTQIEKRQNYIYVINEHINKIKNTDICRFDKSIIDLFNKKIVRYNRQLNALQKLSEIKIREYNSKRIENEIYSFNK